MNDQPRQTLSRIILEHGRGICDTPKRVEALLRDLCGEHRREINIIIGALEERVAADLLAAGGSTVPRGVLLARLAAWLRDNLAYTPEAARWGVETWAVALGITSEAELRERARVESTETVRSATPPPVQDAKSPESKTARVPPPASQPPRGTTAPPTRQPTQSPKVSAPPQQPTQSPKVSAPPTIVAPPAPAPRRMPTSHRNAPVPPPQQNVSPTPSARDASQRGLTLRGCLITVVVLIVLVVAAVFVVPAVIMILKEEQAQPSINDPRIR
jgi:hypothetical protein